MGGKAMHRGILQLRLAPLNQTHLPVGALHSTHRSMRPLYEQSHARER